MEKTDWEKHSQEYEASGLPMKEYCDSVGIKDTTLTNYRYLKKKRRSKKINQTQPEKIFKEFDVGLTFKISIAEGGLVNLCGINPDYIGDIIRAICALSE
jgi:hypothetical protein